MIKMTFYSVGKDGLTFKNNVKIELNLCGGKNNNPGWLL